MLKKKFDDENVATFSCPYCHLSYPLQDKMLDQSVARINSFERVVELTIKCLYCNKKTTISSVEMDKLSI